MREHPILFSGAMVEAILSGRKAQTRRVMKPQPVFENGIWSHPQLEIADGYFWLDEESMALALLESEVVKCLYGYAYGDGSGDLLWVRETWQGMNLDGLWWHEVRSERHNWAWTNPICPAIPDVPPRWLPGIHMPRMACRIELQVMDVRVERVQWITAGDAKAEGVEKAGGLDTFQRAYARLWDEINLKRGYGWEVNPWVWVVEFATLSLGTATSPQIGERNLEGEGC